MKKISKYERFRILSFFFIFILIYSGITYYFFNNLINDYNNNYWHKSNNVSFVPWDSNAIYLKDVDFINVTYDFIHLGNVTIDGRTYSDYCEGNNIVKFFVDWEHAGQVIMYSQSCSISLNDFGASCFDDLGGCVKMYGI